MNANRFLCGLVLLAMAGCQGDEKAKATASQTKQEKSIATRVSDNTMPQGTLPMAGVAATPDDKGVAASPLDEKSVTTYDGKNSKTHGALQVKSAGPKPTDWFDVLQNNQRAFLGNPPLLGSTIELPPGEYVVTVNRTERKITIEAGKKLILVAGELVVEGKGDWYIPFRGEERMLVSNPPILNHPMALFAGTYKVRVYDHLKHSDLGDAKVEAGRKTVLKY